MHDQQLTSNWLSLMRNMKTKIVTGKKTVSRKIQLLLLLFILLINMQVQIRQMYITMSWNM